jgi:hypothetical protein
VEVIQDCQKDTCIAYATCVRVYGATLESMATQGGLMGDDNETSIAASLIVRISEERAASPGYADHPSDISHQLSLAYLCDTIFQPAMEYITTLDDVALLKNALTHCQKTGMESTADKKWTQIFNARESKMVHDLIEAETARTLHQCGLGHIYESVLQVQNLLTENLPLSAQPGLSQNEIDNAMKVFYASLFNPPLPHFDTIKDADLKLQSRKRTAKNVAEVYERIYDTVMNDKSGYDNLNLGHTPEQVRTLLSL